MGVEYGFVSICLSERACSPAGNVTVKTLSNLPNEESRLRKVRETAKKNLINTLRIMYFNKAHRIKLYRFASQLIPLATHEATKDWSWWSDGDLLPELRKIGRVINENGFRVSTHPPQVCVLNSPKPETFMWVEEYLSYHSRLFEVMEIATEPVMVFHLGGGYGNLVRSIDQLKANFRSLSPEYQEKIVLENDDTTFTAFQVLELCEELKVPMVLDIHHHWCNNNGEDVLKLLPRIMDTWSDRKRPPKIHLSSPKSPDQSKAHADYIDTERVLPFLRRLTSLGDVDIMVEAKQKDKALLRFRKEASKYLPN